MTGKEKLKGFETALEGKGSSFTAEVRRINGSNYRLMIFKNGRMVACDEGFAERQAMKFAGLLNDAGIFASY